MLFVCTGEPFHQLFAVGLLKRLYPAVWLPRYGIRKSFVMNRHFTIYIFFQKITIAVTERPKGAEVLQWGFVLPVSVEAGCFRIVKLGELL